jgi:hypothetical protein
MPAAAVPYKTSWGWGLANIKRMQLNKIRGGWYRAGCGLHLFLVTAFVNHILDLGKSDGTIRLPSFIGLP